jgi:acetylornithine deacetylase/succinyl-diaminopimelate desuccinylase-like protein
MVNNDFVNHVFGHIDIEFAVDLVQKMVRTPSVVGDEGAFGRELTQWLQQLSIGEAWYEDIDGTRGNVLWQIESGTPGPRFLLTGHLDTKPVCEGWSRDPYGGERQGSLIFGHAIMDMKAGLACQIAAIKALADAGVDLVGSLVFAGVADHMGDQSGAVHLVQNHQFDHAILGEPTDMEVYVAHRGRYYFDISTIGLSAHTCHREKAINAIEKMLPVIKEISNIAHIPGVSDDIAQLLGPELILAVGRIYGGLFPGGPSMIPDRCTIRVDTRPQPGVTADAVQALLEAAIKRATTTDPEVHTEVVLADRKDSFMVPRDATVVRCVSAAWEHVMQRATVYGGGSWLADTASMAPFVETVIFGPGGDPVYQPNESLEIDDIQRACQINCLASAMVVAPEINAG